MTLSLPFPPSSHPPFCPQCGLSWMAVIHSSRYRKEFADYHPFPWEDFVSVEADKEEGNA